MQRSFPAAILFAAASALCATAPAHAVGDAPQPLIVKPGRSTADADAGSMEALREKLQEKLGAVPDPGSSRTMRVVTRPAQEKASASGKSRSEGARVATREPMRELVVGPLSPTAPTPMPAPIPGRVSREAELAARTTPWNYFGATGPRKWSTLNPQFDVCASGKRQSPIDIRDGISVELEPMRFDYRPSSFSVIDDGHTVQVNLASGNSIQVLGRRYELVDFHFHRPAEEVINGKRHDMSAHLLHRDAEGRLAKLIVLMDRGAAQKVVQSVWNNLPLEKNEVLPAPGAIDPDELLPIDRRYYTYMGSLSRPPCTEGVLTLVLKQPVQVSEAQIDIFSRLYPMNARPLQAANDRLIKQSN